jgi:hypothetical protein
VNTAQKGNSKEVATAHILQREGYIVGSRRHVRGPGDLLAFHPIKRAQLIEVKYGSDPWMNFRPADRDELRTYANDAGLLPVLAWWKRGASEPRFIHEPEWPSSRVHRV